MVGERCQSKRPQRRTEKGGAMQENQKKLS
jgi:hypothetical protein